MAEIWNLPKLFAAVIGALPLEARYRGPFVEEVRAVAIGHDIARKAGFGGDGSTQEPRFDRELLDPIGLDKESIEELEKQVLAYWEMAAQFFRILQEA